MKIIEELKRGWKIYLCLAVVLVLATTNGYTETTANTKTRTNTKIAELEIIPGVVDSNIIWLYGTDLIASDSRGYFISGVWTKEAIYAESPFWYMRYDSNFKLIIDSGIGDGHFPEFNARVMALNQTKEFLLYVNGPYLFEMDLKTQKPRKIDSIWGLSSAVYIGSKRNDIMYYCYGNTKDSIAGYYHYNLLTKKKDLVLAYKAEEYAKEVINGFDVSPDGNTLAVPLVGYNKPPKIMLYNMNSLKSDTLSISFGYDWMLPCLWLRYNKDGSKFLYSQYSTRAFTGGNGNENSETGIIDLLKMSKKVLDVHPKFYSIKRSMVVMANWSPDEKSIVYGLAPMTDEGQIGRYRLFVRRNVDLETTNVTETPTWKLARMFLW